MIKDRIKIISADITKINVSAIVNAANTSLLGGGGVDGAIHRAAGPELLSECKKIGGCPTGEARLTKAYNIENADYIIHTPGPVFSNSPQDSILLKNCYKNSLEIASQNKMNSIAFPAISCGVYGYPIKKAAKTAIETVINFLLENDMPDMVFFVLFSDDFKKIYDEILEKY